MANYTKTFDFEVKDALPSGDPGKIIKGTEFEVEFDAISTAIATKADQAGPTFTGTSTFGDVNVTGSFTSLGIDDNGTLAAITIDATNDVAITNGLTVDGTTLVVDDTNNRVGIGTDTTTERLRVVSADSYQISFKNSLASGLGAIGLDGSDNLLFYGNNAERMRIDSAGRVGIGNDDPTAPLCILESDASTTIGGSGSVIKVRNPSGIIGSTSGLEFFHGNVETDVQRLCGIYGQYEQFDSSGFGGDLVLATQKAGASSVTERMRIDQDGNVGIGTDAPAEQLHLKSDDPAIRLQDDAGGAARDYELSNEGGTFRIKNITNATDDIVVLDNGNVGISEANPQNLLHLKGDPKIRLEDNSPAATAIVDGSNGNLLLRADVNSEQASSYIGFLMDGDDEKMRIDSSGKVGIGTDSPDYKLTIDEPVGTADTEVAILNDSLDSSAALWLGHASTRKAGIKALKQSTGNDHDLLFYTNPSASDAVERMRIDSSGNVLVGTTSAASGGTKGFSLEPATNDRTIGYWASNSTSSINLVAFRNPNGTVGTISTSGSATAYNTSSDERLKENIVDAPAGNIDALQVRSFDWKVNGEHQTYGFIAQELEPVAPYAVTKGETEDDMWSVDYSKLVPMLVKEIQDLKAEVEALKNA